jgi:integrase
MSDLIDKDDRSGAVGLLHAEAEAARAFAARARSANTRRAYRADWADFCDWCDERGLSALPASVETVALYIASRAEGADGRLPLKVSTLTRRLAAISQAHKGAGHESPALRSREPLHSVWGGIVRTKGTAREKVAPTLTDDVVAMVAHCTYDGEGDGTAGAALRARRDRALLLMGFAGALRRSELVAIRTDHLAFGPDGLRLQIPKSKADQAGAGQAIGIAYGDRVETCPVRALQAYVRAASAELGEPLAGPVFRKVDRWGHLGKRALTSGTVARIVKRYAGLAGLDPAAYAGHSLRAGFATQAARSGKPERAIQRHTRHKSTEMLREYIREGTLFEENPSEGIGL